ncbi:MAG: hypothetical protein ACFFC7_10090 [Candidatus Hermodarchaeota archaeon]
MKIHRKGLKRFISLILLSICLIMIIVQPLIFGLGAVDQEKSKDISNKNGRTLSQITVDPLTHSGKNFVDNSPNRIKKEIDLIIREKAIGEQQGQGGGSHTIYDLANITFSKTLNTSNTASSETRDDSATVSVPNGFRNDSGWFNISSITAKEDWVFYETNLTDPGSGSLNSNTYSKLAMEFQIPYDFANASSVILHFAQQSSPKGIVTIINSTAGGDPDESDRLTTNHTLQGEAFNDWSNALEISMLSTSAPLKKGRSYFILIDVNETDGSNFFNFKRHTDGAVDEGQWYYKSGATWFAESTVGLHYDILLKIEFLPVEQNPSNDWVAKTTYSANNLNITYITNGTQLQNFEWFNMNLNQGTTHTFETNVSVAFDLTWIVNVTSISNPLTNTVYYSVNNATIATWWLNFTSVNLSTSYNIRNRTIKIFDLDTGWIGNKIYWNDSTEYTYSTNPSSSWQKNITLSGGEMTVNASQLSDPTNWSIEFNATNYVTNFDISDHSFPYEAYSMETLTLTSTTSSNGNATLTIENPGSQEVYSSSDTSGSPIKNFNWDINSTVDQNTNVNGTYKLQIFWVDNWPNPTRVGLYIRQVDVLINTSLFAPDDLGDWVIGDTIPLSVQYNTTHNNTRIFNANVTYELGWNGSTGLMNLVGDNYTVDIKASKTAQVTYIDIYASLDSTNWYVNWYKRIPLKFTYATSLSDNSTGVLNTRWTESLTLRIDYTNTSSGTWIDSATVQINGSDAQEDAIDKAYYFTFSSDFSFPGITGVGIYTLNLTATRTNHQTNTTMITLTIIEATTDIEANGGALSNDSSAIPISYSETDNDAYTLRLNYYNTINGSTIFVTNPIVQSAFTFDAQRLTNRTWSITLYPDETGSFTITVTFNTANHELARFIFTLQVNPGATALTYSSIPSDLRIDKNMTLVFNWTETGLTPLADANITVLWNTTQVFSTSQVEIIYLGAGSYQLIFYGTYIPVGYLDITVMFGKYGYQNSSHSFSLTLIPYPIWFEAELDEQVTRGSTFVIKITVQKGFLTRSLSQGTLVALANADITLSLTYINLNDEEVTIILTDITDYLGIVEFIINGTITKDILSISEIRVSYDGDATTAADSSIITSDRFPRFLDPEPPFLDMLLRLLPFIIVVFALLALVVGALVVANRRRAAGRQIRTAQAGEVTQNFEQIRSLGSILIRTKSGVPIYSENFLSMEGDGVTLSAMTTAISSFIQDVAQKTYTGTIEGSEFEEMTKAGFNMLARDGEFISIVLLSDVHLGDFIKERLTALQKDLESTLHDELENFFSVEDLDLDIIESLVAKHLYTHILKNMQIDEAQLARKRKQMTSTELKIIDLLKYVPRTAGTDTFFTDSFISEMSRRGIPRADAKGFLMKLSELGILSSISFDELLEKKEADQSDLSDEDT